MTAKLHAGAASVDWTPTQACHLAGYPHVERQSTGVNDPLGATALCLDDGVSTVLFISIDILFVTHAMARRIRERLSATLGLPADHITVAATHTHSGPASMGHFPIPGQRAPSTVVPAIVEQCEDAAVRAALEAHGARVDVQATGVVADATGVGTNRRDPTGPHNPDAPLLVFRRTDDHRALAALGICSMHPTVLHGDSTLVSGDFPAYARRFLQTRWLGEDTPVLYFTGAAGNQSPRHVTHSNTFEEAQRLGEMLGQRWLDAAGAQPLEWRSDWSLNCQTTVVTLPPRPLPTAEEARRQTAAAASRLEKLRQQRAPRTEVRTAEVDWFGAERTEGLVAAAAAGLVQKAIAERSPTEIQLLSVGPWVFVAWPGEVFVEFALAVRARYPHVHVITYANGENRGYLVTAEAVAEGGYEASHALFASPGSGDALVGATLEQLRKPAEAR